jgi:hypothetical protein
MRQLSRGLSTEDDWKKHSKDEQARVVVLRLREMIGTFTYMQDKDIADIFAKEKKRIGAAIGYIDKELHKTPKQVKRNGKTVEYAPWQEQGLEIKWNKYMNEVFEKAKKKGTDYMTLHLGNLDDYWDSQEKRDEYKLEPTDDKDPKKMNKKKELEKIHKDMLDLLKKTREEWDKVKNWNKPAGW